MAVEPNFVVADPWHVPSLGPNLTVGHGVPGSSAFVTTHPELLVHCQSRAQGLKGIGPQFCASTRMVHEHWTNGRTATTARIPFISPSVHCWRWRLGNRFCRDYGEFQPRQKLVGTKDAKEEFLLCPLGRKRIYPPSRGSQTAH